MRNLNAHLGKSTVLEQMLLQGIKCSSSLGNSRFITQLILSKVNETNLTFWGVRAINLLQHTCMGDNTIRFLHYFITRRHEYVIQTKYSRSSLTFQEVSELQGETQQNYAKAGSVKNKICYYTGYHLTFLSKMSKNIFSFLRENISQ